MKTCHFLVHKNTQPDDLDRYFSQLWVPRPAKHSLHLVIDLTQCQVTLPRALKMKGVLNKHRPYSKQYIHHSTVLVHSNLVKSILNTALFIIKTERPVDVKVI